MRNISSNDLEALINLERLLAQHSSLVYYTDGSGIQYQVGATAVNLVTGARPKKCVGHLDLHSVYIGELSLALDLALDETKSYLATPVLIFLENQSATKAINKPLGRSGHFLIEEIYTKTRNIGYPHTMKSQIMWANEEAKAA